jgi:hypothetical protein
LRGCGLGDKNEEENEPREARDRHGFRILGCRV